MNYKKARRLANIIGFAGIGLILLTALFSNAPALLVVFPAAGFICVGINIIIMYQYYRCPHCESTLPFKTLFLPVFCPNCGKKLDEPPH